MPTCAVEGCESPGLFEGGLCLLHFRGARRPEDGPPCVVRGCDADPEWDGLCAVHYARVQKYGDPDHRELSEGQRRWLFAPPDGTE